MKWRVNRAVKRSALPPPSRLLMFVLSDRADAKTAVIPTEHSPSVSELAEETGLGEATVKRHLAALESAGWVVRERPTAEQMARHVPGTYRLMIGKGAPNDNPGAHPEPPEEESGGSQRPPAGGSEVAPETDPGAQSEPTGGSERTPAGAQSEPPSYKDDQYDQYDQVHAADAAEPTDPDALFDAPPGAAKTTRSNKPRASRKPKQTDPEADARFKLAEDLTRQWWERLTKKPVGKYAFPARRDIVLALLEAGHDPDDVAEAAKRSGISLTTGGMEYQLQRLADEAERARNIVPFQRNGHQPYANPTDQSVYFGAIS